MEVTNVSSFKNFFLEEPRPFVSRRDPNWKRIRNCALTVIGVVVIGLLLTPAAEVEPETFHETSLGGAQTGVDSDPSDATYQQLQQSNLNIGSIPSSTDYFYSGVGGASPKSPSVERSASMILTRNGTDSKTQLPAGTRMMIALTQSVSATSDAVPVIGRVIADVLREDAVAIPSGSLVFGDVSMDESSERAKISWKAIQLPDGRDRQFSAVGIGSDNQPGISGRVRSQAIKNVVGQAVTRFIAAYAEGAVERGPLGAQSGGHENGLRVAASETAKDRAESWAEDLKKERKWIEKTAGEETQAVLTQPFSFRDPGGFYR